MTGLQLIENERKRQIEVEGFDSVRDSSYKKGELVRAAVAYAIVSYYWGKAYWCWFWPTDWNITWWKPDNRRTINNLAKSGALIAAEMDRLLLLESILENEN